MKKKFALIFVLLLCLTSFAGCKDQGREEFQESYDSISEAYRILVPVANDLCKAWQLGINQDVEYLEEINTVEYFASQVSLGVNEVNAAYNYLDSIVHGMAREEALKHIGDYTYSYIIPSDFGYSDGETVYMDAYIDLVIFAYSLSSDYFDAYDSLMVAKEKIQILSKHHSKNEQYSELKNYYLTVMELYELCENPKGSYKQTREKVDELFMSASESKRKLDIDFG